MALGVAKRKWSATGFAVGLVACVDGDDTGPTMGPEAPIPTLVAADTTVILRPGESTSLTWTVAWPDGGERPEDVLLQVSHDRGYDEIGAAWRTDFVHGETVTYTFTAGEPHLYDPWRPTAWVTGASVATPVPVEGALYLQVIGGPADAVFPPVDRIDLGVGEVRPFTAYAAGPFAEYESNPNPNFGQRPWSDDPLGFAVLDPAVATVTADGVITAVSEGATTLRITAGEASVDVPLAVHDAPLGPPPLGAVPVFDHAVEPYNVTWAQPDGPLETKAALDADGWPMLVVTTKPGLGPDAPRFQALPEPTVLARWTGTGFGYESLPVPPLYRDPVLTVDEDGHLYLLLHEERSDRLVLWDRPGDVVTGGWREREVPWSVDLGEGPLDLSAWTGRFLMPRSRVAVLPRDEGGVWLAWASHHDLESDAGWCPVIVRLAAATPDALDVHEVATLFKGFDTGQNIGCDQHFANNGVPVRLALLPTDVGSPFPTVAMLSTEEPGLTEFRSIGGAWQAETVEVVNATFDLVWDDIVPIVPVSGPDDVLRVEESAVGHVAWRGPRDGEVYTLATGPDPAEVAQPWADGDPLRDDPRAWWTYLGHATDRQRLYLFANGGSGAFDGTLELHTERMPWVARTGDPEAEGRRLVDELGALAPDAIHVASDGARRLREEGAVYVGDGPDQPLDRPLPDLIYDPSQHAVSWASGDVLHLVPARVDSVSGQWSELRWDGQDWTTARTFALGAVLPGHDLAVSAPTADGGAWVVTTLGGAVRVPGDASAPVVEVPTNTLRPADPQMTGAVARADGGITVVTSMWDRFYVTSLEADGDVAMSDKTVMGASFAPALLRTPSGRLLLPGVPRFDEPATQGLWVSDDDGATWAWSALGDAEWSHVTALVDLGDGRLAMVGTKGHGWRGHQAAVVTSDDDGATWSDPVWVRPDGGTVQWVGAVGVAPGGDLLVSIEDSPSGRVVPPDAFVTMGRVPGRADVLVEVSP